MVLGSNIGGETGENGLDGFTLEAVGGFVGIAAVPAEAEDQRCIHAGGFGDVANALFVEQLSGFIGDGDLSGGGIAQIARGEGERVAVAAVIGRESEIRILRRFEQDIDAARRRYKRRRAGKYL